MSIPIEMTAIEITKPGGPEGLHAVRRPVPRPGNGEVLIRVEAAGVNRPDVLQRRGHYPPPPGASDLPGLEVAGTIVEIGAAAPRWQVNDRVCALVAGGGYAEYCVAPAPQCLPIPENLDVVAAAAIPETFFTVWTNLFQRGALRAGERVLIHGGSSGIGTTAIQLAHVLGAVVYTTAGSDDKCAACQQLGATVAINYRDSDFVDVIRRDTNGAGVDVILDIIGGDYFNRNIECLAVNGRLIQIGLLGGSTTTVDLSRVMRRRLTITGSTLRIRTIEEKGALARELETNVWPLLAAKRVAPVVDQTFPLTNASAAHQRMENGEHIGKLVLTIIGE
jgi:NADPH2:quinone reductase